MEGHYQRKQEEYRQSHIDLLDKPAIISLDNPESYRRILYFEKQLKEWYQGKMGWMLVRTRSMVRLYKEPAQKRSDCALPGLVEVMDFVLFTSILWYGETLRHRSIDLGLATGAQFFVLSQLAETLEKEFFPLYSIDKEFSLTRRDNRQSLVRAIRSLISLGAVRQVDGDDVQWSQSMSGDVLYEFTEVSYRLLAGGENISKELTPEQRAWRTLLLGPSLNRIDDPEAFTWVVDHREGISRQILDRYGDWNLLVAKDYATVLRPGAPGGDSTKILNFRSAISHPMLLFIDAVRERVQGGEFVCDQDGIVEVSDYWVEGQLARLKKDYGSNWGSKVGKLSLEELKNNVLDEMMSWVLIRPAEDGNWRVLPLASRFSPLYVAEGGEDIAEDD